MLLLPRMPPLAVHSSKSTTKCFGVCPPTRDSPSRWAMAVGKADGPKSMWGIVGKRKGG